LIPKTLKTTEEALKNALEEENEPKEALVLSPKDRPTPKLGL
jgi:hypothetical protein